MFKNRCDAHTGLRAQLLIQVYEEHTQSFCEHLPNGALAGAGESGQHNMWGGVAQSTV
jgi:hypothetical protein